MATQINPTLTREQLVNEVKTQAMKWHDKDWGWDFVVEALSDSEIDALISPMTRTAKGAVQDVYVKFVKIQHEQLVYHKSEVEAFGG